MDALSENEGWSEKAAAKCRGGRDENVEADAFVRPRAKRGHDPVPTPRIYRVLRIHCRWLICTELASAVLASERGVIDTTMYSRPLLAGPLPKV